LQLGQAKHACVAAVLQDAVFQYTRKNNAGTFKFRQVVPNMAWEVVPSPVVEVRCQQQQQQQTQTATSKMVSVDPASASKSEELQQ
jgi:hypothetical protein